MGPVRYRRSPAALAALKEETPAVTLGGGPDVVQVESVNTANPLAGLTPGLPALQQPALPAQQAPVAQQPAAAPAQQTEPGQMAPAQAQARKNRPTLRQLMLSRLGGTVPR